MKNPGRIVRTKSGMIGRTYNKKGLIKNKVPVYLRIDKDKYGDNAILCDPETLIIIGFID